MSQVGSNDKGHRNTCFLEANAGVACSLVTGQAGTVAATQFFFWSRATVPLFKIFEVL